MRWEVTLFHENGKAFDRFIVEGEDKNEATKRAIDYIILMVKIVYFDWEIIKYDK